MKLLYQAMLVASGSALGGLARWGVASISGRLFGTAFPWGTFLINMSGCLLLGWFYAVISEQLAAGKSAWLHVDDLRLVIAVGFAGAFTTFSTFELETYQLMRDGEPLKGMAYPLASVVLGFLAVRLGVLIATGK